MSDSRLEQGLERTLFGSRWLLAPMYLGLVASLVMLVIIFFRELFIKLPKAFEMSSDDGILAILTLIDLSLAGNLLLIVIFSGYENFVSKIDEAKHKDWPEWMGKIDFTGLKLKLMSSIVAISAIQLLRAFMNVKNVPDRELWWQVGVHLVFVVSGLVLALTDRLSPSHHGGEDAAPAPSKDGASSH